MNRPGVRDPQVPRLIDSLPVSRETRDRLDVYVKRLREWQDRINLVSPTTIDSIWERHIADCFQLVTLKPDALRWVDMGSGGGLPGIVIACALAEKNGAHVCLLESNHKKSAFLRALSVELGLPTTVYPSRIEECVDMLPSVDIVTARALAPLSKLLRYSNLLLKKGAVGLFPKGRDYESELTEARRSCHFSYRLHGSLTDPGSRIIELTLDQLAP
jgi:16S rRNA (guanine527-N7)-methyltransferase